MHFLAKVVVRSAVSAFAIIGVFVVGIGVAHEVAQPISAERKAERADLIARMVEKRGCWTHGVPEGVEPTHAIVTRAGERPLYVRVAVARGIEQRRIMGRVHAYCP